MTIDGLVSTGLVAGTSIMLGFGMMNMVSEGVKNLNTKAQKSHNQRPQNQPRQQKSQFFDPNFNYKPMGKVSNAKQYYAGYKL